MDESRQTPFALIFADLTILLLTFLIFLNAIALPDSERSKETMRSVGEQFSAYARESQQDGERLRDSIQPAVLERLSGMSNTTKYSSLVTLAERGGIEYLLDDDAFIFIFPADELFRATDNLSVRFLPLLREIAEEAGKNEWQVTLDVHTAAGADAEGSLGWDQSMAQSMALFRLFVDQGIPPEHVYSAAHGSFKPRFSNDTEDNKQKNRRVSLTLKPGSGESSVDA